MQATKTDVPKKYGKDNDGVYVPFTTRTQYINNGILYSCNADSGVMNHYDAVGFSKHTIASHAASSQLIKEGEFVNVKITEVLDYDLLGEVIV